MARPAAISISSSTVSAVPPLPPWDRSIEVGFNSTPRVDAGTKALSEEDKFRFSVAKFHLIHRHPRSTFDDTTFDTRQPRKQEPPHFCRLPPSVRMRIWRHVLDCDGATPDSLKPIRMNPASMLRPVWRDDQFDSYSKALAPARGAMLASFAMRAEVLAMFFMTRRFHVVFSPHVGLSLSPLAIECVFQYGCLMQYVTLEIDFSKLSFGPRAEAAGLRAGSGILGIGPMVDIFVEGQRHRKRTRMENLVILCRRFCNPRPNGEFICQSRPNKADTWKGDANYVEDSDFQALDGLMSLRSIVASGRFVGFPEEYTAKLMRYLNEGPSPKDIRRGSVSQNTFAVRPSTFYPLLPGQRSWRDHGKTVQFLRLDDHDRILYPRSVMKPLSIRAPSIRSSDVSRVASVDTSFLSIVESSRISSPAPDTTLHSPPRTRPTTPVLLTSPSGSGAITPPATPNNPSGKFRIPDSPLSPRSPISPRSPLGRSRTASTVSLSFVGKLSRSPSIASLSMRSKREDSNKEIEPDSGKNLLRKLREIGRRDSTKD